MRTDPDAQAMQAALEALESATETLENDEQTVNVLGRSEYLMRLERHRNAITALRERLADSAGADQVLVPIEPPESIPPAFTGSLFDVVLFDLANDHDYRGLYREFIKRYMEGGHGR